MRRHSTKRAVIALTAVTLAALAPPGAAPAAAVPDDADARSGCRASWTLVPTPPASAHLQSVQALARRDVRFTGYLTGSAIGPWLVRWQGRTVTESARPPSVPGASFLPGEVSYGSPDAGWMLLADPVGNAGWHTAVRWHDGRWAMAPTAISPDPQHTGLRLDDVATLSADDAWAVGISYPAAPNLPPGSASSGALIEHWNGAEWSIVDNPAARSASTWLSAVTAVSERDVWAVGRRRDESGTTVAFVEHYDGTAWREVPVPTGRAPSALNGIDASGPDDVWAVGAQTREGTTNEATPLVMHWDGRSWSVVDGLPEVGNAALTEVYAAGPDAVWAVGSFAPGERVSFLHKGAGGWSAVPAPGPRQLGLTYAYAGIDGTGPRDVWAVGSVLNGEDNTFTPQIAHFGCGGG